MNYIDREVTGLPDHISYRGCCSGAFPFVFIFEKERHLPPTEEQLADYDRRAKIVEANGGTMRLPRWGFTPKLPLITQDEAVTLEAAVRAQHPDLKFIESWNGSGCGSMSIGCRKLEG